MNVILIAGIILHVILVLIGILPIGTIFSIIYQTCHAFVTYILLAITIIKDLYIIHWVYNTIGLIIIIVLSIFLDHLIVI
jgi:hypothetical protein